MPYHVGIDVSKWKHDVFAMDQDGAVALKPFQIRNDAEGFSNLLKSLEALGGKAGVRICMESTGHYHRAVYGFLFNYVNYLRFVIVACLRQKTVQAERSGSFSVMCFGENDSGLFRRITLVLTQLLSHGDANSPKKERNRFSPTKPIFDPWDSVSATAIFDRSNRYRAM